jgi:hypothetical protein
MCLKSNNYTKKLTSNGIAIYSNCGRIVATMRAKSGIRPPTIGAIVPSPEAQALRERFEAEAPKGHTFEAHQKAVMRTCAYDSQREFWREGYRKAGFPV